MMLASLETQSRLAPGSHRTGVANRCTALATAVGVVAGVHDGTTAAGTDAHVALTASLAEVDVLVVDVRDLADNCGAVDRHIAHLTRGQTDQSVAILLSHQLSHVASGTNQLSAAAGIQLDVMDDGTDGDVLEGQAVAGLDVGALAADDNIADLQAVGSDDVVLDTVSVLDQSDECAAVRIVLQSLDGSGHIGLLTLEVDDTILGAVAAALMADGDTTGVVAATMVMASASLRSPSETFSWLRSYGYLMSYWSLRSAWPAWAA